MLRYYVWRVRFGLMAAAGIVAIITLLIVIGWILNQVNSSEEPAETLNSPSMFIVERTYTKETGYTYIYSDGKFLFDNNLKQLPKLSPSVLDRIEIDIETPAAGVFETYAESHTINPLSISKAGFQYDIPYNFYGTQQDIALYIALMLGAGFEAESLIETKDSAILELIKENERVRIVVGRNRLRVYSKMIGINEFG